MKKFLSLLVVLPVIFVAGVVFAESPLYQAFSDFDEIPSWAQDAAEDMNDKGVLTGYANGNFGPNDTVTRAQLAAVVDRFEDLVLDISERKSLDLLYAIDDLGYIEISDSAYDFAVLMAEAGMRRSDMTLSEVKNLADEWGQPNNGLIEVSGLPEGYSVYNAGIYEFYVVFKGMKSFGQDGWEVTEVYGPFSGYDFFNRYNSADFY